ncbi:hypothetical protein [Acinetobacter baumannii]|uniref:hypothetical protein n=1 Tax=Acinetobacter baumannii TaxID=470 RepID=UPI0002BBE55A|nr:hypothetical protein [Acinetobacter baumannii]ENV26700.1 hypothetical protein F962_01206 [Acinetobacter baumannii NIPH 190]OTR50185.1 hypothetical protein CAT49_13705 [Acinetobacter baumannii]RSP35872.1 hypothetical protein EA732_04830 [Acinetobacter baumannii]HAV4193726.1 hypothetical protein [Acinetobacter baumannii]
MNVIKKLFQKKNYKSNQYIGLFNIDLTDWWKSSFSSEERELIYSEFKPNTQDGIGTSTKDSIFTIDDFNINNEAVIPFLENLSRWLRKHKEISNKIYLKFIEVSTADPICDVQRLREDKNYLEWFISRNLVLFNIFSFVNLEVKNISFNYGNFERAPNICKELNNKVFNLKTDLDLIVNHWGSYEPNCRCVLLPEIENDLLID